SVDPVSGLFTWTPPSDLPTGAYPIGVVVTDSGSPPMNVSQTFTVNVVPFNHPPVLAAIPVQTVAEGSLLTGDATATDDDAGQTIAFNLGAGAPAGAAIDARTGVPTWTPDPYAGSGADSIPIL